MLKPDERAALAAIGRMRTAMQGEIVFAAGEEDTACSTLVSGALKVVSTDSEGNERILALIHPAGFVGEMFRPFAEHDVVALGESRLCTFARSDMEAAIERFPALARALLRRSQEDLHAARDLMAMTGRTSAEARIAAFLLAMARAASDSPCHPAHRFELPLSRGEIASLLGLTIETVSRRFGSLEASGAIRRNGLRGIELVDPARLLALSGEQVS